MGATIMKNGNLLDAIPPQGTLHIVMLGLDSAGKTTALYRLKFDQYLNTVPTIGFNCEKVQGTVGKAKGVHFLVWDVGGQEKLRPLWRSYTRCTDGILFVVDSVDTERMEEAKMELMRTAKCPDNQGVPVLILANKQDLPNACCPKDLEKLLGLHELQQPLQICSMLTSSSSTTSSMVGNTCNAFDENFSDESNRTLFSTAQSEFPLRSNIPTYDKASEGIYSTNTGQSHIGNKSHERNFSGGTKSCVLLTSSPSNSTFFPQKYYDNLKKTSSLQLKGWFIQPACAITGEGLQEGLEALYDMILKRRKINKSQRKKR